MIKVFAVVVLLLGISLAGTYAWFNLDKIQQLSSFLDSYQQINKSEQSAKKPEAVILYCLRQELPHCRDLTTTNLHQTIAQTEQKQGGFPADPILRAQNWDNTNVTAVLVSKSDDTAEVEGTAFGGNWKLIFAMKFENQLWRIDDTYCPGKPETSLIKTLNESGVIPPCH